MSQQWQKQYAAARAAHPELYVSEAEFSAHLEQALPEEKDIRSIRFSDLYVACAICNGSKEAAESIYQRLRTVVRRRLSGWPPEDVEDAMQSAFEDVITPNTAGLSPLSKYSGLSSLEGWLAVIVCRKVGRAWKATHKEELCDDGQRLCQEVVVPADILLKDEQKALLKECFQRALAMLEVGDRVLLKQYVLDHMSSNALAGIYGVHRATISRRLEVIRDSLRKKTIESLRKRAGIDSGQEVDEFLDIVASNIDLSLSRILRG